MRVMRPSLCPALGISVQESSLQRREFVENDAPIQPSGAGQEFRRGEFGHADEGMARDNHRNAKRSREQLTSVACSLHAALR